MLGYITMTSSTGALNQIGQATALFLDYNLVALAGGILLGACILIYISKKIILAIKKVIK